jgi:hypothetical protein
MGDHTDRAQNSSSSVAGKDGDVESDSDYFEVTDRRADASL